MIGRLEDPMQENESMIHEQKYRIKNGVLQIHQMREPEDYIYWRTIVPYDQGIKLELLKEIHDVPYSGHPGSQEHWKLRKDSFIGIMSPKR